MCLIITAKNENDRTLAASPEFCWNVKLENLQYKITNYSMTLHFKIQFLKVSFNLHETNRTTNSIKSMKSYSSMKRKYQDNPEP